MKELIQSFSTDYNDEYIKKLADNMNSAKIPDFRYGLNIKIEPSFDFSSLASFDDNLPLKIMKGNDYSISKKKHLVADRYFEKDAFHYFNRLLSKDSDHIFIDKNKKMDKPIIIENSGKKTSANDLIIEIGENSEADIIYRDINNLHYSSLVLHIIAKKNSKLNFIMFQSLPKKSFCFHDKYGTLEEDAKLNWIEVQSGSGHSISKTQSFLKGKNSKVDKTVLYSCNGEQKFDFYTSAIHGISESKSDIVVKGIANGNSEVLSRSLVKINDNASNSEGYEKQEALLLSDQATVNAIPNLEIKNHDVRCSHGSSVSEIDKMQLYYLMSRGLSENNARVEIIKGFFTNELDRFSLPQDILREISEKLYI